MLEISKIQIDHREGDIITDRRPIISFALNSDIQGEKLDYSIISCNDWSVTTEDQLNNIYGGMLLPHTEYEVKVRAFGKSGESAEAKTGFITGKLDEPWIGKWITDNSYVFPDGVSPVPMVFKKELHISKKISKAWIHSTALGIYEMNLNGQKVGDDYFAPGFTSYQHQIQYQTYDLTGLLKEENLLMVTVAGGWAAGSFTNKRKSHISCDRQAFLAEMHVIYEDGSKEIIATDENWFVSMDSPYKIAEFYDGEDYDASFSTEEIRWEKADITTAKGDPLLLAQYGPPVRRGRKIEPVNSFENDEEIIYDMGENFGGIISFRIRGGKTGQTVRFRHAEVLVNDKLFTKPLRTAKASIVYHCTDGEQEYTPRFTYMGFRYVGVSGIEKDKIELYAYALHSDIKTIGYFHCSNVELNKLQENIVRSGLANFVDIPTDCPQRDERMGWTGDTAVFSPTACFNFDMSSFYGKWLRDMSSEQSEKGGLPMVVPRQGDSWPVMATSCWGDSCVLVPWATYLSDGDVNLLKRQYPTMKKFLKAALWWSNLASFGDYRYIWDKPFHFGDWCAADEDFMGWISKAKWIGTAYFANSCAIMSRIADLLNKSNDKKYYENLRKKIEKAYRNVLTDGKGKLKKEFQSAYVLPLTFKMTDGEEKAVMIDNFIRLLESQSYEVKTGFPATPYILFALADNGHEKEAYQVLFQKERPGWLYAIEKGATSIWERWDAMKEDGTVNLGEGGEDNGGMVSFNHYANGAVGNFLYTRIGGLESLEGGYRRFRIQPVIGMGIVSCEVSHDSPFGIIESVWKIVDGRIKMKIKVPVSCECELVLPSGKKSKVESGTYEFEEILEDLYA